MKNALLFLLVFTLFSANAQEFTQDDSQTKVNFKIKNFGVNVDGDFGDVKIQTNLDSENLAGSYINATIEVSSIATGIKKRDEHILEEDYFDVSNYPAITLKSTKIEKTKVGTFLLYADLTIKKTTKKIEIPIQFQQTDNNIMIQAKFQINRRDYKVGGGSMIMSKKVKIEVEYTGTK
jgi:polyisoprenoid-binding protein YceI